MTKHSNRIFDRLRSDTEDLLTSPAGRRHLRCWGRVEPLLAGLDPVSLLGPSTGRSDLANERLAALVRLAATDRMAAQTLLAAVVPGLAAAANQLARAWASDPDEIDQAVIAAAWEKVASLSGLHLDWPAAAIVVGARGRVRASLVTEARRRQWGPRLPTSAPAGGPEDEVLGARFLAEAAGRGVVSGEAAHLVWATRVLGYRLGELARPGRTESTLRVTRWRAERALRAVA
jgi:hypothetical protein